MTVEENGRAFPLRGRKKLMSMNQYEEANCPMANGRAWKEPSPGHWYKPGPSVMQLQESKLCQPPKRP